MFSENLKNNENIFSRTYIVIVASIRHRIIAVKCHVSSFHPQQAAAIAYTTIVLE